MSLADLAEDVLHRHLRVLEDQGRGRAAAQPQLVLFAAGGEAHRSALDDQGGELVSVHLEEDHVDVGEAAVGDPHLPAVDDVVPAVLAQARDGLRAQRVRTAPRLGKRVRRYLAAGGQVGEVLRLLLRGPEEGDGQGADADVGAEGGCPRAVAGLRFGHEHGGGLVEP